MLGAWLRESRVQLPTIVVLETWLWESGVPASDTVLISSANWYRIITLPASTLTTPLVVYRGRAGAWESRVRLRAWSCLKHGFRRAGFDPPPQANFAFVDYQMAFSPICSVVYALGLVRLISRCYAVPQCSTHPNRCRFVPSLSIPFGFPFVLACPVLAVGNRESIRLWG
jgi:hypothetical protein